MSDFIRLSIAVMAYGGQVTSWQSRMWLELGAVLSGSTNRFGLVSFSTWDVNPVDRARNMALAEAMMRGADWLLMIDADTFVEARRDKDQDEDAGFQLLRMISDADRLDAAIVVAPVKPRSTDANAGSLAMVYEWDSTVGMSSVDLSNAGRKLTKIDSAATAVMAVSCRAAHEAEARFVFTDKLSEDHEFCRQIREHGGKIYVDPRVRTGHLSKSFPIYV